MALSVLVFGQSGYNQLQPPTTTVPASFFGMHIHRAGAATAWPAVPVPEWRLWDAHAVWPDVEPTRGQWNFDGLDKYVSLASQHNTDILLPLGLSPRWASARSQEPSTYQPGFAAEPADIEDWRTYVRTVATRYKGRIHAYEIWNEPNLKQFWTGTTDQMVVLVREASQIIRGIEPHAIIVSPSATSTGGTKWLAEFLKKGGGQYVDVIGYHFYVNPQAPEAQIPLIQQVKQIMADNDAGSKPLWNTETGWMSPKPFPSEELGAAYLARACILNWAAGVQRFYWYAWDNHGVMSIETTQPDNQALRPAGLAYATIQKWLVGARLDSCSKNSSGTWTCQLNRTAALQWIVWNERGSRSFGVPTSWHATTVDPLLQDSYQFCGPTLDIGESPVLVRSLVSN